MIIQQGNDGTYTASQMSAFGRIQVADHETRNGAVAELLGMLHQQIGEAYHHEQAMTHLSITESLDGEFM